MRCIILSGHSRSRCGDEMESVHSNIRDERGPLENTEGSPAARPQGLSRYGSPVEKLGRQEQSAGLPSVAEGSCKFDGLRYHTRRRARAPDDGTGAGAGGQAPRRLLQLHYHRTGKKKLIFCDY